MSIMREDQDIMQKRAASGKTAFFRNVELKTFAFNAVCVIRNDSNFFTGSSIYLNDLKQFLLFHDVHYYFTVMGLQSTEIFFSHLKKRYEKMNYLSFMTLMAHFTGF